MFTPEHPYPEHSARQPTLHTVLIYKRHWKTPYGTRSQCSYAPDRAASPECPAGCHDRDIPPSPVHPQSRLHAALFALNSPHPNPIHIQTLSPPVLAFVCTLQHLRRLCKHARRDATPFRLARTSLTNREHSRPNVNHGTRSKARASEHNSENSRLRSRATSAPYDKSLFSFCIHFGFSSSRLDICTLALPFTFSLLIPGSTHPRHPPLSSVVSPYCTRLAFTPGLTASHSRPRI